MKIKYIFYYFLVISLIGCNPDSKQKGESIYQKAISESHRMIDSLQTHGKIPGIDVAISIKGEIVWAEGFGYADLELKSPVITGQTRFRIGSVSKPLTSAALGKLIDMGKIDVMLPVQNYVSYFPEKNFPISVKQTGGHIAGIRHYNGNEFLMSKRYESVKSGLDIFKNDPLLFEPGTDYSYSSYGYNLISAVIEGASEEDFLNFINREVFLALDMSSTCADKNDSIIENRTSFYEIDSDGNIVNAPYVDNSYKWAGGGFISTTTDMIKFGEAHIKHEYLTESTLKELTTSQVLTNGNKTNYGIGWATRNDGKYIGYGHSGGSVGGITQLIIYPEYEFVIVLLSNSSDTNYGNTIGRIVNLFLNPSNSDI